MQTATEILRTLVAIPSVSALNNTPLLDAIANLLEPHGWHTQRFPYIAADGTAKANMLAIPAHFLDSLPAVDLLFVCHTDTVPYRADWAGAVSLTEEAGMLHGCGSCDVKGSLAGLLAAALQVDTQTIRIPVAFAFTAEEEIGCIGATKLVASAAIKPRQVIVCEPTSLRPATAGKGYGLAEVLIRGHEAHSAFPAKGVSAINIAAHLIVAIEQQGKRTDLPSDPLFQPPTTTFNVGILHGGSAKNIVAGEATFLVEWRPIPSEAAASGGQILQHLAAIVAIAHPGCTIDVKVLRADAGFARPLQSTLGETLSRLAGRPETGISFGSEATRFAILAEEIVVIGPGDMETAHSERECIPIAELDEWTSLVAHLLVHGVQPNLYTSPRT